MENKVNIIKKIVQFHPSEGKEMKYSWYTGGMADTGAWYWEKMIDEPIEKLQEFLEKLENNKKLGEIQQKRQDKLRAELGNEEYYRRCRIVEEDSLLDFFKNEERALMWGSPMPEQKHWEDYYNDPKNYWNARK